MNDDRIHSNSPLSDDQIERWMADLRLPGRAVEVLIPGDTRPPSPAAITGADFDNVVLLSGSFNPLHAGHLQMADWAAKRLGVPVWFELSIRNADKPPLARVDLRNRLVSASVFDESQPATNPNFQPHGLFLSSVATFDEKARIFRGCWFAIGVDTLIRIADLQFYEGSALRRDTAIRSIASAGCRFLVFGRAADHRFVELSDLDLPHPLRAICQPVPRAEFQNDLSSSQLRDLK